VTHHWLRPLVADMAGWDPAETVTRCRGCGTPDDDGLCELCSVCGPPDRAADERAQQTRDQRARHERRVSPRRPL
jgi:ribosomal protein L37E